MLNVHASGGVTMMQAAKAALADLPNPPKLITAVTVLTSMDKAQLASTGIQLEPLEQVQYLAKLAQDSGLDGVVCSAQEAAFATCTIRRRILISHPRYSPRR